jgi:hypothetical protein
MTNTAIKVDRMRVTVLAHEGANLLQILANIPRKKVLRSMRYDARFLHTSVKINVEEVMLIRLSFAYAHIRK